MAALNLSDFLSPGNRALPDWLQMALAAQGGPSQGFPQDQSGKPPMSSMAGAAGYGAGVDAPQQPDQAQLPQTSMPIASPSPIGMPGGPQGQQAPAQQPGPDLLDRLSAGATNFTTGGNPIAGLLNTIRGFSTGERTDHMGMMLQQQRATMSALAQAGVPAPLAQAAALNPEILKSIAPTYFGGYKVVKTGQGVLGENYHLQGPGGRLYEIGGDTGPGSVVGGGGTGAMNAGILAAGVKTYDPTLPAEQYLNQFGPDMQSAIKAYINGDVMPSGNPRQMAVASQAKQFAQTYGQKAGIPVSDDLFARKRKMQTDIASSGNSSMGGIISNGQSAFEHLALLSDAMANLGNASHDFIGGAHVASGQNYFNNVVSPSSETKSKITAVNDAGLKYGQESTKFYAGSGGGEGERMAALKANNPHTSSGAEQAAFLDTEKKLMLGRLQQKEAQIRDTLGDQYLELHPVMTADMKRVLAKIDSNIARLRGEAGAQQSAAPGFDRAAAEAEARKRGLIK